MDFLQHRVAPAREVHVGQGALEVFPVFPAPRDGIQVAIYKGRCQICSQDETERGPDCRDQRENADQQEDGGRQAYGYAGKDRQYQVGKQTPAYLLPGEDPGDGHGVVVPDAQDYRADRGDQVERRRCGLPGEVVIARR